MKKRFLFVLLALVIMAGMLSATTSAAGTEVTSGTCGDNLTWNLDSEGKLTISGTGPMTSYAAQSDVPWSSLTEQIKSVVMEEGLTTISAHAFSRCYMMETLVIPTTMTRIEQQAFYWCNNIKDVYIFDANAWIKTVFVDSYSSPLYSQIGNTGFCTGTLHILDADRNEVTEIVLDDDMNGIVRYAFLGCRNLKSVVIPERMTYIGNCAFWGCTSLTDIVIPDAVTEFGISAFNSCTALTEMPMGNGVTRIGNYAFYGCTGLTDVVIPDHVTSLGDSVFQNCSNLETVVLSDNITTVGLYAFYYCTNLRSVTGGNNITVIKSDAFNNCTNLTEITLPDTLTSIGQAAFVRCKSLTNLKIPRLVTSIGIQAFMGCGGLESLEISGSVTNAGQGAFSYCYNLTSVKLGKGITTISDSMFSGCSSLKSIEFPETVTAIGKEAFYSCYDLESVIFTGNAPSFGTGIFTLGSGTIDPSGNTANDILKLTAYYPKDNATWTSNVLQDYGGKITWVSCCDVLEDTTETQIAPGEEAVIHIDADHTTLKAVYLDGKRVASSNYTITEGSTIITFKPEFLAALKGDHVFIAEFADTVAVATIRVSAPARITGDIDGDETVDLDDALALLWYALFPDQYPIDGNVDADFTADGVVNVDDVLLLLQHVLFPADYPL